MEIIQSNAQQVAFCMYSKERSQETKAKRPWEMFAISRRDCSEQSGELAGEIVQCVPNVAIRHGPDADPTRAGVAKAWQIIVRIDVYIFVNVG